MGCLYIVPWFVSEEWACASPVTKMGEAKSMWQWNDDGVCSLSPSSGTRRITGSVYQCQKKVPGRWLRFHLWSNSTRNGYDFYPRQNVSSNKTQAAVRWADISPRSKVSPEWLSSMDLVRRSCALWPAVLLAATPAPICYTRRGTLSWIFFIKNSPHYRSHQNVNMCCLEKKTPKNK